MPKYLDYKKVTKKFVVYDLAFRRKSEVAASGSTSRRSPRNRTPTSDEELKKKSSRKDDDKSKSSKQLNSTQDKNTKQVSTNFEFRTFLFG